MSFVLRFLLDGNSVVFLIIEGGNIDIYLMDINSGFCKCLINVLLIEIVLLFSLDGKWIVFESDCFGS